jgi:hypothetical protein
MAAIMMANAVKLTARSWHIGIQLFALLKWVKAGYMLMPHVPGTINPLDALTKPLGWVIHHHHCYRVMGTMGSPYSDITSRLG